MITAGVIILAGMILAYTMIEHIQEKLLDTSVEATPIIFMIVSIPIIFFGIRLLKTRPRKPKKNYLEDGF